MASHSKTTPRVALVHDWLTDFGGAERVLLALHEVWPNAPIYTTLYRPERLPQFAKAEVRTSYLQGVPLLARHHRIALPLMPAAVEAWDFSDYDVVISSTSSGCAKGIITKPDTLHISYCHNPSRVLWGGSQAYGKLHRYAPPLSWLIPRQLKKLRLWDRVAADRVDFFLANSECVARRIEKYYQAEAEVIYPPVDTKAFAPASDVKAGNYFLAVGRLIPYKRFDLVVQAANVLGLPLRVVGTGPEEQYLRSIAGPTVKFFGSVSEEQLRRMYAECKALVFPQEEDFGLTAVEVQAAGRPVVAYRAGGALETVVSGRTGIFFTQQTVAALGDAMERAAKTRWVTKSIQKNAERFDLQHFKKQIDTLVTESFAAW